MPDNGCLTLQMWFGCIQLIIVVNTHHGVALPAKRVEDLVDALKDVNYFGSNVVIHVAQ